MTPDEAERLLRSAIAKRLMDLDQFRSLAAAASVADSIGDLFRPVDIWHTVQLSEVVVPGLYELRADQ